MFKHRPMYLIVAGLLVLSMLLGACAQATVAPTTAPATEATNAPAAAAPTVDIAAALKALETSVSGTGPNGEQASKAADVVLTDAELAKIKDMKATAAIVMHYGGNDWSTAQIAGLKDQFAKMGIEVIAVTDANFKPEKQVSDIETVLAKNPSIIVSIPTDPVATADAYRKAAAQGVKLVFMDNVPKDFASGKDYTSVVSADNYGNGVASGLLMCQKLQPNDKVGLIYHEADFFVTKQRYNGVKDTLTKYCPNVQIVEETGIGGPDFAGDGEKAASAMVTKYPDLKAIWAVWDVPAEGVMAALRSAGKEKDIQIFTQDLGTNVAVELAKNGVVKGLGAQRPFDQGVTEALLAGYALLGKEAPAYVALYALPVTHDNVLDAWKAVYHADAPDSIKNAFVP